MNILVVARHPGGGIRTYFRYVYGEEVMSDVSITFLTPKTDSMESIYQGLGNVAQVCRSENTLFSLFKGLLRLLLQRPDLVHSHGFTAAIITSIPAVLLRVPHVATTHDVFLPDQFKGMKGRVKRWLIGTLLKTCTVINPVGRDAMLNMKETYPRLDEGNRIAEIRNGIDSSFFMTDQVRDLRAESSIPDSALLAGFFGRFMAQKGFGLLVEAVERMKDSQLPIYVACFGWGGFIREEQAALEARGLTEYFHFFPATDEMPAALRGVDIVVMPSRWEACPLLPMEAMVAGAPVLGSDCIGLKEVIEDTPSLMFPQGSVDDLIAQLKYFKEHQPAIKEECVAFRPEAADRFDVGHTAKSLHAIYSRMTQ
ncbi:glycosyltransferase family 4 protein [Marinobacter sp. BGYM27]|uniref:glycosyltransferase family 4 protein n=1 Tax=Marinobacter sp. BGYM27 TaxID=2975597 RepID=UPI0021A2AF64|nr:glycosyltransferase family 4 protein [Marinobacter sp. BGYM27]MDG5499013.1 glycosyltransferase family 4 protein [Marinobacter sp. BGYM27]